MAAQRLLGQMRYEQARKELMAQFKISRSVATRAIQLARILMAQVEEQRRPHERAVALARLERIADNAEDAGEHGDAVRAWQTICKIRGLYAPEEIKVPGLTLNYADLSDEQLAALAKLDAKANAAGEGDGSGNVH